VKDETNEIKPTAEAAATSPKQAGEAAPPREPWGRVERCVWTEGMLTRLAPGEPANRVWFSLLEKRRGRTRQGLGAAQQRWPNEWFARRGLLSLAAEHEWPRTIVAIRTH
jgi:hypothetical protein